MKKSLILIALIALSTSCIESNNTTYKDRRFVCTKEQKKKVQDFISESIKDANNMSDEEMEDVIQQLEWTGVKCNCEQKTIEVYKHSGEIKNANDTLTYYNI